MVSHDFPINKLCFEQNLFVDNTIETNAFSNRLFTLLESKVATEAIDRYDDKRYLNSNVISVIQTSVVCVRDSLLLLLMKCNFKTKKKHDKNKSIVVVFYVNKIDFIYSMFYVTTILMCMIKFILRFYL